MMELKLQESDFRAIKQLQPFSPENIFDAHLHISHGGEKPYGIGDFLEYHKQIFPCAKTVYGNAIIMPVADMADRTNGVRDQSTLFLKQELDRHPNFIGEVIVLPDDTVQDIENMLTHERIRGLKCYHLFSKKCPTWNADIEDYLPESAWQVAHKHGLCITLHLVKDSALADENNMAYILRMAKAYPNAKLILAHCGRAFASWTVMGNAPRFRDIPNIYFDIAAICESPAIFECIRSVGVNRVLWGSDFPISAGIGKPISIADTFLWLYEKDLNRKESKITFRCNMIAIEEIRAFSQAAYMLGLSREDIKAIFFQNAYDLFFGNRSFRR